MNDRPTTEFAGTERFRVVRRIGAGGMGVVYEVHDQERDVRVALKTLPRIDAYGLMLFKQEFRALADVIHPNLVTLHELVSLGDQWFFTMEYVEGVSFLKYVRETTEAAANQELLNLPAHSAKPAALSSSAKASESGPETRTYFSPEAPEITPTFTEATADYGPLVTASAKKSSGSIRKAPEPLHLPEQFERLSDGLVQLASGIMALHRAGKLHRDIKPSNVLVTAQGRVVLLDFGLVTELREEWSGRPPEEIVGTVAYMAPEQAKGAITPAADWYSVGVMLYEALTGQLPFSGTGQQILEQKFQLDAQPPRERCPGVPRELGSLCMDLLNRSARRRPTGAVLLQRLREGKNEAVAEPTGADKPSYNDAAANSRLLVGRERHLETLRQSFAAAEKGKTVVVYVHGRSGVGKSVLIQHALDDFAVRRDVAILTGRCHERESVPYKALDSLIDSLSRYLCRLPAAQIDALMPADAPALARLFPVLRRVSPIAQAPAAGTDIPDQQELRRRTFAALRELLTRLGQRKRLLLFIDDLQWGDTDSAALLTELLRPPDSPPLCLWCSYRTEYAATSPCLQMLLQAPIDGSGALERRELAVEPLSLADAESLAFQLLGGKLAATNQAALVARESQGSPYFIQVLVADIASGAQRPQASEEKITLDEVLWKRVRELPETSRRLLEVVAVSGKPLRQKHLYQAAHLQAVDPTALNRLRITHLVRGTGPGELDEIEAYHDRIRETISARLDADTLKQHHTSLALMLETLGDADPERLAFHFLGAGEPVKARNYYTSAAGEAANALAFDRSAELYRRALDLPMESENGARELRIRLADALANRGRGAEAARAYEAAAVGATAAQSLEMRRLAAVQYSISGHFDEGLAVLRTVLAAVNVPIAKTSRAALFSLLRNRFRLRLRGLKFRARPADQISAAELARVDTCWSAVLGLSNVEFMRTADFQVRGLLLALRAGDPFRITRALALEAIYLSAGGSRTWRRTTAFLKAAQSAADALAPIPDQEGGTEKKTYVEAIVTLAHGTANYLAGRYNAGLENALRAEQLLLERCTGVAWELNTARTYVLWSLLFQGDFNRLARVARDLGHDAQERGDLFATTNLNVFILPAIALAAGNAEEARRLVRATLAHWPQHEFTSQHLLALYSETDIDLYNGDGQAAWERISSQWPAFARSLHSHIQSGYVHMLYSRARSALASAATRPASSLLKTAEQDAGQLEREGVPQTQPQAGLIRAGLAMLRKDKQAALAHLRNAADGFAQASMHYYLAATRRRLGSLLGEVQGRELTNAANAWMASHGIQDHERMTAVLIPGFPRGDA